MRKNAYIALNYEYEESAVLRAGIKEKFFVSALIAHSVVFIPNVSDVSFSRALTAANMNWGSTSAATAAEAIGWRAMNIKLC